MIPPIRILDKIRRQQNISRATIIELLNTRTSVYKRLVSKHAGKSTRNRIEAYAYLLHFTEKEIEAIVEYSERYNLFLEHRRKTKGDDDFATLLANLYITWNKLSPESKQELHTRLLQVSLKYNDLLPNAFIAALNDCNNST